MAHCVTPTRARQSVEPTGPHQSRMNWEMERSKLAPLIYENFQVNPIILTPLSVTLKFNGVKNVRVQWDPWQMGGRCFDNGFELIVWAPQVGPICYLVESQVNDVWDTPHWSTSIRPYPSLFCAFMRRAFKIQVARKEIHTEFRLIYTEFRLLLLGSRMTIFWSNIHGFWLVLNRQFH